MDIERIVVRMTADASQYLRVFDVVEARLVSFGGFLVEEMLRSSMRLAMEFERMGIAFEVMTGSAEKGQEVLQSIVDLAVRTPFTSQELAKSAKQAMAFGFEMQDIIPILSRVGDVSVATGTDMDRLILALGQVRTTGRLMGQELRQFTNAGVPILQYLAKVIGVSESAVPQLVRMGRVSFSDVAGAFNMMTSAGGRFFGMMERTNLETVFGRWQNFTESIQVMSRKLGEEIFAAFDAKNLLTDWTAGLNQMDLGKIREGMEFIRDLLASAWNITKAIVDSVKQWAEANPNITRVALTVLAVAVGLKVASGFLTLFLVGVGTVVALFTPLVAVVGFIVKGLFAMGAAVLTFLAPFAAVIAFFVLLPLLVVGLTRGWGELWRGLKEILGGIASFAWEVFSGVAGTILDFFVGIVNQIGRSLGRLFDTFGALKDVFGAGFGGAFDAFSIGEMEIGFRLLLETVKFGFKLLWEWVKLEWNLMWTEVGINMLAGLKKTWQEFIAFMARTGGAILRPLGLKGATNEQINADRDRALLAIETQAQRELAEAATIGRQRIEELADSMRNLPEALKIQEEAFRIRMMRAVGGDLAEDIRQLALARQNPDVIPQQFRLDTGGAFGGIIPAAALEMQAQAATDRFLTALNSLDFDKFDRGEISRQEWERQLAVAREARAEFTNFRDALNGTAGAARMAARAVSQTFEVAAEVRQYTLELEKDFNKGATALDRFARGMSLLEEAAVGPWRTQARLTAAMAAIGVPGIEINPKLKGLIGPEVEAFGLAQEYEKLRRSLPKMEDRRPPAALEGSREAAEIIGRAQNRQLTVQEQMAADIRTANEIHRQQAEHTRQVADEIRNLRRGGGAVPLPVRGN